MNYNAYWVGVLLLLSSVTGLAQQQADDTAKSDTEQQLENQPEQEEEAIPEPPPKPPSEVFKPSTEISDDSPVAFPVDI